MLFEQEYGLREPDSVTKRDLLLSYAMWLLWGVTICCAFFLPIYIDEILWKYHFARSYIEGQKILNFLPVCQSSRFLDIPLTTWPWRTLETWFYTNWLGPHTIRFKGMVIAALVAAEVYALVRLCLGPTKTILQATVVTMLTIGLGVMPFLLAMNRPEQDLLAAFLGLILLSRPAFNGSMVSNGRFVGFLVLVPVLMSTHPKTLFLVPVILFLIFGCVYFSRARKIVLVTLTLVCARDALLYSLSRMSCPEFGSFAASPEGTSGYLTPIQLILDPAASLLRMVDNFARYPYLVDGILFRGGYGMDWIQIGDDSILRYPAEIADLCVRLMFYGLILTVVVSAVRKIFYQKSFRSYLRGDAALGCLLILTVLGFVCLTDYKPAYEVPFLGVLFAVGMLFVLKSYKYLPLGRLHRLARCLPLLIIAGQALLLLSVLESNFFLWMNDGYLDPNAALLTSSKADKQTIKEMSDAALSGCEIDLTMNKPLENLFVDEAFYMHFHTQLKQPLLTHFLRKAFVPPRQSLEDVFVRIQSAGLVGRCNALSPPLRQVAVRVGKYCCLPSFDRLRSNPKFASLGDHAEDFFKTGPQ